MNTKARSIMGLLAGGLFLIAAQVLQAQESACSENNGSYTCVDAHQESPKFNPGGFGTPTGPTCQQPPPMPQDEYYGYPFGSEADAAAFMLNNLTCAAPQSYCDIGTVTPTQPFVSMQGPAGIPPPPLDPLNSCRRQGVPGDNTSCYADGYEWHYSAKGTDGSCTPAKNTALEMFRVEPIVCPAGYALYEGSTKWICMKSQAQNGGCCVGHPILPAVGAKTFAETDFSTPNRALEFSRDYNSYGFDPPPESTNVTRGILGRFWRTNYDTHLYLLAGTTKGVAALTRRDGTLKYFDATGQEYPHFPDTPVETLVQNANGTWSVTSGTDVTETYDSSGRLVSIWDKTNQTRTLTYDANNRLQTVTDQLGRTLGFAYTIHADGSETVQMTTAAGEQFVYALDGRTNLVSVTYPDGQSKQYLYEKLSFPNAITGVMDENGSRYETADYDSNGLAIDSYLAPNLAGGTIERHSVTYGSTSATITYPLGKTSTIDYAVVNHVIEEVATTDTCSTCASPVKKTASYDPTSGYPVSKTDFNGNQTTYVYNARGLEATRTEAHGTTVERTTTTNWNATFRAPDQRSVFNGSTEETRTKWTYNARGQVTARCQIDPSVSAAASYTCGSSTNAPAGVRQWTYTYCDTASAICPMVGLLLSMDGPRTDVSDVTTYTYYVQTNLSGCATLGGACHYLGDLQFVTNALNQTTTYVSYDKNGRPTRIQDANGVYTDLTYHPRGWVLTRTVRANANGTPNSTLDATTTIAYDNAGNVTRVTQPDGAYLKATYDAAHRLTDLRDAVNDWVHFNLDASGNRTSEVTRDPTGNAKRNVQRHYDALNRLVATLNSLSQPVSSQVNPPESPPVGVTFTDGYDGNGNRIYSIDGTSSQVGTEQQFDALNRLVKTLQDHAGTGATHDTTSQYAYDARDNLRSVTDPDGLVTAYTYDALNNLTEIYSPDTGYTDYTYDAAGNRITLLDANHRQSGAATSYAYDALNRLIGVTYPTAGLNVTYTYDQVASGCFNSGRLTSMVDHSGTTTYCYDQRGNVVKKSQTTADASATFVVQYQYSLADRLMSETYPSGMILIYTRDAAGRISSVAYKTGSTGTSNNLVTSLSYYPYGPQNVLTFANGRTLTKTYDKDYAIDSVVSSNASGLIIDGTVDVLGNLINASSAVGANPATQQYQYDALYRLTNIQNGSGTSLESFTYGPTGDRLSKTLQGQSAQTYAYGPGTHHLTSVAGVSRTFDPNGNTKQLNGITPSYDDRNRMSAAGGMLFDYNGRGERVSKAKFSGLSVPQPNAPVGVSAFVYSENGSLLSEWAQFWVCTGGTGTQVATSSKALRSKIPVQSTVQPNVGVQQCPESQTLQPVWEPVAEYIYVDNVPVAYSVPAHGTQVGALLYYVEADQLGTPRQVIKPGTTTANDTTVWKWDYFANNSAFGENAPSVQTVTFNLRFPGQYYDVETGLNYNIFRDYESTTGRYVQSDPIGMKGGISTYSYVSDAPLNQVDLLGLEGFGVWSFAPGTPDYDDYNRERHYNVNCGCSQTYLQCYGNCMKFWGLWVVAPLGAVRGVMGGIGNSAGAGVSAATAARAASLGTSAGALAGSAFFGFAIGCAMACENHCAYWP